MEHQLDLTQSIIIPYLNFAFFLVALVFLFRKPLVAMAASRRNTYLEATRDAQKALEMAQEKFTEIKKRHDSLDAELAAFKSQSEANVREEAKKLVDDAERLSIQIREETKKIAQDAIFQARHELRQEITQAAVAEAAKKITANLGAGDKKAIIQTRINDLHNYHT